MKISVLGLWHLGCVYSAGLAYFGHTVNAWDEDENIIANLRKANAPIYEPQLNDLIKESVSKGKLNFYTDLHSALKDGEIIWIAYDTPVGDNDNADCDFVYEKIKTAVNLSNKNSIIIVSSQLPAGSIRKMEDYAKSQNRNDLNFVCAPENLRLGKAIEVFSKPDRIICGIRNTAVKEKMKEIFAPITDKVEYMSIESAEITKHAVNAFLAMSVVFANEIASICEMFGGGGGSIRADAKEVERGLKTESRIGKYAYLGPGLAFAGGTLARDIAFLSEIAAKNNKSSILFPNIAASNAHHKRWVIDKTKEVLKNLKGRKISLWGLTYKPETNTLRRSAAIEYAKVFKQEGAEIFAYDPSLLGLPSELKTTITLCQSPDIAAKEADILIICSNWKDFLDIDADKIVQGMKNSNIIDPTRFLYEQFKNAKGYYAVGLNI
ncbi:MAG: nucleotide sugar dehydrogenase [Elusimicrobiota bacterium]|nr:nucleotide sugar dehydrogenase [Elusimicrobiota bacterium]